MAAVLAFMGLGYAELLIVLAIALLLFGGSRLPSLMRNIGRSANEFQKGLHDVGDDDDDVRRVEDKA